MTRSSRGSNDFLFQNPPHVNSPQKPVSNTGSSLNASSRQPLTGTPPSIFTGSSSAPGDSKEDQPSIHNSDQSSRSSTDFSFQRISRSSTPHWQSSTGSAIDEKNSPHVNSSQKPLSNTGSSLNASLEQPLTHAMGECPNNAFSFRFCKPYAMNKIYPFL